MRSGRVAVAAAVAGALGGRAPAARADPPWLVDLSARGVVSVEARDAAPVDRASVVPALAVRVTRRVGGGGLGLGGAVVTGLPAYRGQQAIAATAELERALAARRCDGCARWTIAFGLDAGVALTYFDAPPETMAGSDAVLYWGPLLAARGAVRASWVTPTGRELGAVLAGGVAAMAARYVDTATGRGLRVEPAVELGLTLRL